MAEVETKRTNFTSLLVYDVSRWGRFQDLLRHNPHLGILAARIEESAAVSRKPSEGIAIMMGGISPISIRR